MKPERWQQIDSLLDSALELNGDARAQFLAENCADDAMRAEVESLLAAHVAARSFIETPALHVAARQLATNTERREALVAGQTIGRYEIRQLIGTGGMGEVYLAEDRELERPVALKVLPAEVAADQDRIRRFVQEAKAISALNHPNILTIHEIGQTDGARFIASEYVTGETLRDRINAAGNEPLTLREILEIVSQVAAALNAAHEAGIVHRDVKPENIMLRADGVVKVLDFGLAKLSEKKPETIDPEAATRLQVLTAPGLVMGTVAYMSPEQARGKETDARTDMWSLGVVLYELLSGRQPFEGETASDSVAAILLGEPAPLGESVPAELNRIVRKSLQKNRDERYQTSKDFLLDLKNLKRELEFTHELERLNMPTISGAHFDASHSSTGSPSSSSRGTAASLSSKDRTTNDAAAVNTTAGNATTGDRKAHHTASSAEYVVGEIKRHKSATLGALALLAVVVGCAVAYYAYSRARTGDALAIKSVAVLPFVNASDDPNNEYLSDGLSERLIDSLSQLPQLKVIARNSSFKYRGADIDLQQVARALDVQAIVIGRVMQRGDELTVRAELVDAESNKQIWSDQYRRRASDLQTVQEVIAQRVSEQLRLRLTGAQERQLTRRETDDSKAYELLLRGRFFWNKGGAENNKRALAYYEQATTLDPDYALAHAETAVVYRNLVAGSILDPKDGLPRAESAAQRAIELDDNLAAAHYALAIVKTNAWEWTIAEREYRRAIELNPNLAFAHAWYSRYLTLVGRHEQAIAEIERARELDPLSLSVNANHGLAYVLARRPEEAITELERALELDPNYSTAHTYLGYAHAARGAYREAIAEYEQAIKLGDDTPGNQIYLAAAYAGAGEQGRAREILQKLEASAEYVSPGELAILYGALGERERAFASLERAYIEHDLQLQFLNADPSFDGLRDDPRFRDIVRRVGLPQ